MCVLGLPFFSRIIFWCECHEYLRTGHRHVLGWPVICVVLVVVGWNIFVWIILGLILNKVLYLVMFVL